MVLSDRLIHSGGTKMEEFDAPENGVKQMREALDRQAEKNKKLEAELALYKEKEIDSVFGEIGLETNKGFGKALKQVYDGPINKESIAEFAKTEYGFEPSSQVQNEPQTELEQPVQDDARSRVAALDANSVSDIPQDVNEQLAHILQNGSVKDSLAAKLNIMDQQK